MSFNLDLEERIAEPSAHPAINDDELASISSRTNEKSNSPTFKPRRAVNYGSINVKSSYVNDSEKEQTKDLEQEESLSCCTCWTENRFVIVMTSSLLVCLAAPLYLLIRFAHFEFDFHKECVECFNGKGPHQVVFNQSIGTCDEYFRNETYDSNNIVLDPNFCGAPHCQNLELLPGVRPVPYWSIAVSALFSIVLSAGVNLIKYNCYLPMKKKFVKWKWDEDIIEQNPLFRLVEFEKEILDHYHAGKAADSTFADSYHVESVVRMLLRTNIFLKTFGLTDPYLFILLGIFALGHFGLCVYEVLTNPSFAHLVDGWQQYQTIYGLFLNSGSIDVLWFWLSMGPLAIAMYLHKDLTKLSQYLDVKPGSNTPGISRELVRDFFGFQDDIVPNLLFPTYQFKALDNSGPDPDDWLDSGLASTIVCMFLAVLVTLPVFLTHIIPGILLFIPYWSWIFLVLFLVCLMALFVHDRSAFASIFLPLMALLRLVGSFCVLLLFPVIFNWTVLFYEGRTWSDVMTGEYLLRNTDCYFDALVNGIQIYNIGFVGLIFS